MPQARLRRVRWPRHHLLGCMRVSCHRLLGFWCRGPRWPSRKPSPLRGAASSRRPGPSWLLGQRPGGRCYWVELLSKSKNDTPGVCSNRKIAPLGTTPAAQYQIRPLATPMSLRTLRDEPVVCPQGRDLLVGEFLQEAQTVQAQLLPGCRHLRVGSGCTRPWSMTVSSRVASSEPLQNP